MSWISTEAKLLIRDDAKQIAKIMKSPESTVKSRYQKAMQILKEKAGE